VAFKMSDDLEKEVVSLELALRLQDIGIIEDSTFSWYKSSDCDDDYFIHSSGSEYTDRYDVEMASAYTLRELVVILLNMSRDMSFSFRADKECGVVGKIKYDNGSVYSTIEYTEIEVVVACILHLSNEYRLLENMYPEVE
jgi:hypothetical protein